MTGSEIIGGITAAKEALTLLKGVKSISDNAKVDVALNDARERIAETQDALLLAQQSLYSLAEENRDLKDKLMEMDEWKSAEAKYPLREIRPGLFLRVYEPTDDSPEPAHWACPKCFAQKKIQILQQDTPAYETRKCPECGFSAYPKTSASKVNSPFPAPKRRRDYDGLM